MKTIYTAAYEANPIPDLDHLKDECYIYAGVGAENIEIRGDTDSIMFTITTDIEDPVSPEDFFNTIAEDLSRNWNITLHEIFVDEEGDED